MFPELLQKPAFWAAAYIALMSLVSIAVTWADKRAAQKHRRRVPERTLLWLAALGGGVAMYIAMRLIRHKTQKAKFMVGIPAILMAEAAAAGAVWWFLLR